MGLSKTSEQSEGPWALQQVLTGHHGAVYDLATDASGALWSAGGDGWLVRWAKQDSKWSEKGEAMVRTEGALFAVHPHETGIVAGGENGGLVHWTPDNTRILEGHEGGAYELAGPHSGGADGRLLHWPTQQVLGAVPGRVRCCAQTDSGWVVGTHEGELHHLKMGWSQKLHEGSLRAILPWPGKSAWGTVGADGALCLWRASESEWTLLLRIDAHKGSVYRLQADPLGRWVATSSRDRSVALWNPNTLALEQRLAKPQVSGHTRSVNALCFLGPETLASAGDDGQILIWNLKGQGQPISGG